MCWPMGKIQPQRGDRCYYFLVNYTWWVQLSMNITHAMGLWWNNVFKLWHRMRGDEYAVKIRPGRIYVHRRRLFYPLFTRLIHFINRVSNIHPQYTYIISDLEKLQYSLNPIINFYINHIATHCICTPTTIIPNLKIHVELMQQPQKYSNYYHLIITSKV